MFDAAHKSSINEKLLVEDFDGGNKYKYGKHTLSFSGEHNSGEVHIDEKFYGYYKRGEDDIVYIKRSMQNGDETLAVLGCSEADYERFAVQVLSVVALFTQ